MPNKLSHWSHLRGRSAAVWVAVVAATTPVFGQQSGESEDDGAAVKVTCIEAHRTSQQLRLNDQLLEARDQAEACAKDACPAVIRQDCSELILTLDKQIPSVVVQPVGRNRATLSGAKVFLDGTAITATSGSALQLNPGEYSYRVEAKDYKPAKGKFVLFEGQQYREIVVQLEPIAEEQDPRTIMPPPPSDPQMETYRPVPPWTVVLAGLGVAGVANFGVWAALGRSEESELKDQCSPRCTDDDVSTMNTRYTVADVSLVVGGVMLTGAAITYFARPRRERRVGIRIAPTGVSAGVRF